MHLSTGLLVVVDQLTSHYMMMRSNASEKSDTKNRSTKARTAPSTLEKTRLLVH